MDEPKVLTDAILQKLPAGRLLKWGYAYDPGDNKHWAFAWEYLTTAKYPYNADPDHLRFCRTWFRVDTGEALQEVNP